MVCLKFKNRETTSSKRDSKEVSECKDPALRSGFISIVAEDQNSTKIPFELVSLFLAQMVMSSVGYQTGLDCV